MKWEHQSLNGQEVYSVPTAVKVPQLLHFNVVAYLGVALSAGSVFQLGDWAFLVSKHDDSEG